MFVSTPVPLVSLLHPHPTQPDSQATMKTTDQPNEYTTPDMSAPKIIPFPPSSASEDADSLKLANEESDEQCDDSDQGEEDQVGSFLPSSYRAPQLGLLSLPSPTFGASIVDLFAPLSLSASSTSRKTTPTPAPGSRTPSRIRTSSNISRKSYYSSELREPTLYFGKPRELADKRRRREGGKAEDCWVAAFPEVTMELSTEDPGEWLEEEWNELGVFLEARGYQIDETSAKTTQRENVPCYRTSDSLLLHLILVPIDDVSYELDVLEHLSQAGICSNAHSQNVIPNVPVVGLVPLSEYWTAVLIERWDEVDLKELAKQGGVEVRRFVRDLVGAVSFLHSQHISHLAISPSAIRSSPCQPLRFSLTSFSASHQFDPLLKRRPLVGNMIPSRLPVEFLAPERIDRDMKFDPFKADLWAIGKILREVVDSIPELHQIVKNMLSPTPTERPTAAEVFDCVKKML